MSSQLETVTIVTDNGPVRINKSDYDAAPDQYKLASPAPVQSGDKIEAGGDGKADKPADLDAPAPQLMVMKDGKGKDVRHYVVDAAGERIDRDGIDAAGYATEKEAWDAILALPK